MKQTEFAELVLEGIPDQLPPPVSLSSTINHAPKRKQILAVEEKKLAVRNALRYFPVHHHAVLAKEFRDELETYGRIYMHRFRPTYKIFARSIDQYPHRSREAAAIMLMISNNLDEAVAQHPHELITYGGNGAVFQNWAQYRLTMKYLATMTDEQTLVLYSGHPLGLFPSQRDAPRVVITNGLMVPNYSKPEDWERFNALGTTQYGQMTAGSFMYIGPQGIVHGTTLTILNAGRRVQGKRVDLSGTLFVSSGLGGMSGAQAKAAVIAGAVGVIAEINPAVVEKRRSQGWVDEVCGDLNSLIPRIVEAKKSKCPVSIAYVGNVVDLWERLAREKIPVELGSDQTSLHNPFAGGYYPAGLSFDESQQLMVTDPKQFRARVEQSLVRQVNAINELAANGMYFFDYGNAFLLEASRAGAAISKPDGSFRYPSYVQDIMGPLCFDYGFGPFRWICTSSNPADLALTDQIATTVLESLLHGADSEIAEQLEENLRWIRPAQKKNLVVGSQARILYADEVGRVQLSLAFNKAIREQRVSAPIVIGRDHHDVSGTDSPYRETSDIADGSRFTADMSVHNFVGDAFRGATWVSLHNGGGVGWGEVMNGGFGLMLDGSDRADQKIRSMISWDVTNGIARRSWARNRGARRSIELAMKREPLLRVTLPNEVDERLL